MTAALIVATGGPGRGAARPMAPLGAVSVIQRQVLTLQLAAVQRVVVVAGAEALAPLQKHLAHMGVVFLPATAQAAGQLPDALRCGLAYLRGKARAALVVPWQAPLFAPGTVQQLLARGGAVPLVPEYQGRAGQPLLLPAEWFGRVPPNTAADSLAAALAAAGQAPARLPVEDAGVLRRLCPPGRAGAGNANGKAKAGAGQAEGVPSGPGPVPDDPLAAVRPMAKLCLAAEKPFYGPGPHLLLALVDETHMLRTACRLMGISYSKGWKMLAEMERQSGRQLVEKTRGGADKGHSRLTAQGRQLLQCYQRFQQEANRRVAEAYREIFGPEWDAGE